jgi:hypothetical protein
MNTASRTAQDRRAADDSSLEEIIKELAFAAVVERSLADGEATTPSQRATRRPHRSPFTSEPKIPLTFFFSGIRVLGPLRK